MFGAGLVFTMTLSLRAAFKLRKRVLFHVFPDRIDALSIWKGENPRIWRLENMDLKFSRGEARDSPALRQKTRHDHTLGW